MEDGEAGELGGDAARSLNLGEGLIYCVPGLLLMLDVDQGLEQRVVIEGLVPGGTPAPAHERIKLGGLEDEVEALEVPEVDQHVVPAASVLRPVTILLTLLHIPDVTLEQEEAHRASASC